MRNARKGDPGEPAERTKQQKTDTRKWNKVGIHTKHVFMELTVQLLRFKQNYSVIVNFITVAFPLFVVCAKGIKFEPFDIVHDKFTSYHFPLNFIQDRFMPAMPVCACVLCNVFSRL